VYAREVPSYSSLFVKGRNPMPVKLLTYGSIVRCLDYYETKNGENYGDYGYYCKNVLFPSNYCAFGPMQFWQTTFKHYCMDKYNLTNNSQDIFNRNVARQCTDLMIGEGLISSWSTAKYCY